MVLELIPRTKLYTDIIHPYPTVLLHAFLKGIQGGLIAGFFLGNAKAFYKRFLQKKKKQYYSWKYVVICMGKAMVIGIVIATGLTLNKLLKSDLKQNQSRAFRLKIHKKQNIIDNATIGGLIVGQLVLRDYQELEMGGGYIGALVGLVLINLLYMAKEALNL